MKIGLDISSIVYGTGVSRYTANLTRALLKHFPNENYLLYGGSLRQAGQLRRFVATFGSNPKSRITFLSPVLATFMFHGFHLPIETITGPLDVFHSWDWYIPNTRQASLVTTIHDLSAVKYPKSTHPSIAAHHRQTLRRLKESSAIIIAVSQNTKQDLIDLAGIPAARIKVIYEALPQEQAISPPQPAINAIKDIYGLNKPYFLIVASQEPRKNLNRMIKAFAPFKASHQLVLVGKSGFDRIQDTPYLIKTGYINAQALACLYRGSEGLLYASLDEGFGLPVLEAFYHGIPVVVSDSGSLPEVAGPAGSYCHPTKVSSISQAISQAINHKSNLIKLGTKQLQKFSWEKVARQTMKVYQSVT